jgi:hypothetical protein
VRLELADSPTSLSLQDREAIDSETIDNTKLLLESLSSAEMANGGRSFCIWLTPEWTLSD